MIGYCTNVHPGVSLEQIKRNLEQESLAVKQIVYPNDSMGIGLWLSSTATEELMHRDTRLRFRDWLQDREIIPYTVNAFPAGPDLTIPAESQRFWPICFLVARRGRFPRCRSGGPRCPQLPNQTTAIVSGPPAPSN